MDPKTQVESLQFIGPTYSRRLSNLGIKTVTDLLYHFPTRYEDLTHVGTIANARVNETITLKAGIWQINNTRTKNGKFLTTAVLNDGTGTIEAVWFNQPYLSKTLKTGMTANFSGKVSFFGRKFSIVSPDYEIIRPGVINIHTGRLVPIYPETYGVSSKWLRSRIKPLLETMSAQMPDYLPPEIRESGKLMPLHEALNAIHFPGDMEQADAAKRRFSFEELFFLQLRSEIKKIAWKKESVSAAFNISDQEITTFKNSLPFKLTDAQNRVMAEITKDLNKTEPMNRLLEGDVGSGKTVVAALAIYLSFLNKQKAVLMAPTEILVNQHFATLQRILTPLGLTVLLQTGSKKMVKKDSRWDCLVGTHALLNEKLALKDLGLVVVDEQHRFGVEQRALLRSRGKPAHFLTMTATPIPRTMALTVFGELDLSVIDQMPFGRKSVKTYLVPPEKRASSYEFIRKHVHMGEQIFIIAPFIEPSETIATVRATSTEFKRLTEEIFPDLKIGLLHGKLKSIEKEAVLTKFRKGGLNILVATPVVEVGIDIPNATIMVIEGAERFGLAQIHQLRGRVGRSDIQSYCFLFTETPTRHVLERLKLLEKYQIGMEVAEADLKTRGPGDIYGTMQHGLPNLKVASFNDLETIEQSHLQVTQLLADDPELHKHPKIKEEIERLSTEVAPD